MNTLRKRIKRLEWDLGLKSDGLGTDIRKSGERQDHDTDVAIQGLYRRVHNASENTETLNKRIDGIWDQREAEVLEISKRFNAILDYFGLEWKALDPIPNDRVLVKKQKAKA